MAYKESPYVYLYHVVPQYYIEKTAYYENPVALLYGAASINTSTYSINAVNLSKERLQYKYCTILYTGILYLVRRLYVKAVTVN